MVKAAVVVAMIVFAQTTPTPDLSPTQYWGVAGFLLTTLISVLSWLLVTERREHKDLQRKVIGDFLPAILESTAQQRATTEALQLVSSRPNIDPSQFKDWQRTMERIQDRLDDDDRRRRDRG